jgi:hypothetical protein
MLTNSLALVETYQRAATALSFPPPTHWLYIVIMVAEAPNTNFLIWVSLRCSHYDFQGTYAAAY